MYILQKRLQFNGAVCVKKETNEVNAEKRRKLNRGSRGRVSESQKKNIEIQNINIFKNLKF